MRTFLYIVSLIGIAFAILFLGSLLHVYLFPNSTHPSYAWMILEIFLFLVIQRLLKKLFSGKIDNKKGDKL